MPDDDWDETTPEPNFLEKIMIILMAIFSSLFFKRSNPAGRERK